MLQNVFLKTLRDRRRSLIGWTIGLIAYSIFILAFFPTIRDSAGDFEDILESIPPALRAISGRDVVDIASPVGYLNTQVFNLMAPLLLLVFAIGFGARTVAGEEQEGTLELVLAAPIPRWRLVTEKFAAMLAGTVVLGVVLWVGLAMGAQLVDMDLAVTRIAGAVLSAVLLALVYGSVALAVGCLTAKRSIAVSVAVVLAVAAYLIDAFAPLVDSIDAVKGLSPFYYYGTSRTLSSGIDPVDAAVLVFLTLVLLGVALVAFDRRDARIA
jgi:ABC-2 type transport system permease protein